MPPNRRHVITETPSVRAALDELRRALATDRIELGELVVLGAGAKVAAIRHQQRGDEALRRRLADRVRSRDVRMNPIAADEVRTSGWTRR